MSAITLHVHGAMPPGPGACAQLESGLGRDLRALGYACDEVRTYAWRSGHPSGAALTLGSLALLGGGLLGVGVRAAWLCASAGAAGGAAASYRAARLGLQPAARGLARTILQLQAEHREVHVIAHSLGTDVAVRALGHVAAEGRTLPGVFIAAAGTARGGRDYARLATVAQQGVVNIYNPMDLALLLEIPVRWASVIGRSGMRGAGITNVKTSHGHMAQLPALAEILGAGRVTGRRFAQT
jgi:hypothetical protein